MFNSMMSMFDPCILIMSKSVPVNWLEFMLMFSMIGMILWTTPSGWSLILSNKLIDKVLGCELLSIYSLFLFMLLLNLMGLIPSCYSISSSFMFGLSMSMPFWSVSVMIDLKSKFSYFTSHLVPEGSNLFMAFLLVWIELISLIMRPISLAIRMVANITAGHILMCLVETSLTFDVNISYIFYFLCMIIMYFLETAVALIQAFVFSKLLTLYWSEIK